MPEASLTTVEAEGGEREVLQGGGRFTNKTHVSVISQKNLNV